MRRSTILRATAAVLGFLALVPLTMLLAFAFFGWDPGFHDSRVGALAGVAIVSTVAAVVLLLEAHMARQEERRR